MECTEFEKQVIAGDGVVSQEQQRHLLSCDSCRGFVLAYGLAAPSAAPSPELDARARTLALMEMRRQRRRRRLRLIGQVVFGAAAALVFLAAAWRLSLPLRESEAAVVLAGNSVAPQPGRPVGPEVAEDYWLLDCALTLAELEELEIDLSLRTTVAGDFRLPADESRSTVSADAYRDLSNQLLTLEFDLHESL